MDVDSPDRAGQYQKRREQVRRAQRTHRERKATYVRSLEQEVVQLRTDNATYEADAVTASEIIRQLQNLLISNGLSVPQSVQARIDVRRTTATALLDGDRLSVTLPVSDSASETSETTHSQSSTIETSRAAASSSANTVPPRALTAPGSNVARSESETMQMGVDFVLALEHVCIHHRIVWNPHLIVQGDMGATGHEDMLQSSIMRRAPPYTLDPFNASFRRPTGAEWHVPAVELERLLTLSRQLNLSGEITPIEAWQKIRYARHFDRVSAEALKDLTMELQPSVYCHGFGAAIDENVFQQSLHTMYQKLGIDV